MYLHGPKPRIREKDTWGKIAAGYILVSATKIRRCRTEESFNGHGASVKQTLRESGES